MFSYRKILELTQNYVFINQISNLDTSNNLTIEYSFITPNVRSTPTRVNTYHNSNTHNNNSDRE